MGLWWYGDDGPHLGMNTGASRPGELCSHVSVCVEQARRVKTVKGHILWERDVGKTVGSRTSRDVHWRFAPGVKRFSLTPLDRYRLGHSSVRTAKAELAQCSVGPQ